MEESEELYLLYEESLEKWNKVKKEILSYEEIGDDGHSTLENLIFACCSFCKDTRENRNIISEGFFCSSCKVNKNICNHYGDSGVFQVFDTDFSNYYNIKQKNYKRRILFLTNTIIKMIKFEMNQLIFDCVHEWKFTGHCFCMACSEFFKAEKMKMGWNTHGNIVSQCKKCGVLFEKEYGFFNTEEIENFKTEQGIFPDDIINPIGIFPLEPSMLCGVWFRNDGF